jgi:hypothetical protein
MGGAYDTCWGQERWHTRFWWGDLRERDHLEEVGVDRSGKISTRSGTKRHGLG